MKWLGAVGIEGPSPCTLCSLFRTCSPRRRSRDMSPLQSSKARGSLPDSRSHLRELRCHSWRIAFPIRYTGTAIEVMPRRPTGSCLRQSSGTFDSVRAATRVRSRDVPRCSSSAPGLKLMRFPRGGLSCFAHEGITPVAVVFWTQHSCSHALPGPVARRPHRRWSSRRPTTG